MLAALGAALVVATVSGCGTSGTGADTGASTITAEAGAYPVTVEHRYGATTVESAPERIAVVGYSDEDFVLAFGGVPVLTRKWYNDEIQPWQQPYLQAGQRNLVDMGTGAVPVEKVAAAKPDLIIGVYSGISEREYQSLSKIAPVIVSRAGYIDYGQPWQDTTRQIGAALGQPAKAEQLVNALEARFAAARTAHPQWAGRTVSVATFTGSQPSIFGGEDPRPRFFQNLGFRTPAEYDALTGDSFHATVSLENARLLDQDLLVWDQLSFTQGGRATIAGNPSLAVLGAMRENRTVYLDGELEKAFGWQTVLSLPAALDGVIPLLEQTGLRG
ncbi:iron-siderophore ABC transporter substrate-binding protein [Nocardia sp. 2]|uniref:Iron-siderophore ABC transporter substrate-binding protein n=1 Tax=Nocardia acididurans TaxID=2802282 RepID=A0ABS1MI26_9NOCA|nr:iron-siderophore ABC transporter substrate-binding protein [Nocardia acididurans]MBL1078878.1 iron-siderophore ABC transporter substrate-binding protein [Nocardia acididurans]